MKTVITYGTFDLFHYGHYFLLKRAKALGDKLIVGVSSDQMCIKKGKSPVLSEMQRMEIIADLSFVDAVLLERNMEQKVTDVIDNHVDIFVLGNDYEKIFPQMPEYDALVSNGCKVVFLPRTENVSTSVLKEKILHQLELNEDIDTLHNLTNW